MAFTVRGELRDPDPNRPGTPYELTWTGGNPPVEGTAEAVNWLEAAVGQTFGATPVGPFVKLENLADADQVLTALMGGTRLIAGDGELPTVVPELPVGAVG